MSNAAAFLLMCAIWGTTWIAMAEGARAVPPMLFAGSRFLVAGLLLLAWEGMRGGTRSLPARAWRRLVPVALLNITLCYGPLFWGMRSVDTGIAAVVNLSLTPVALYGFGLLHGAERWHGRSLIALGLGGVGLILLLGRAQAGAELIGIAAIVFGTLSYCWGSVLCRPLVREQGTLRVAGLLMTVGGGVLILLSLALEPLPPLAQAFTPAVLAAWSFLVLAGSLAAYTIYLRLLRDWGPLRAGLFAFVSPIVAVALGALLYGETVTAAGVMGMALMLGAAAAVPRA